MACAFEPRKAISTFPSEPNSTVKTRVASAFSTRPGSITAMIIKEKAILGISKLSGGLETPSRESDILTAARDTKSACYSDCGSLFSQSCDGNEWCLPCYSDCGGLGDGVGDLSGGYCSDLFCGNDGTSAGGYGIIAFGMPSVNCTYPLRGQVLSCYFSSGNWHNPLWRDVSGAYIWSSGVARLSCGSSSSRTFAFAAGYTPDQSVVNIGVYPSFDNSRGSTWSMATPYSSNTGITVQFLNYAVPLAPDAYCEGQN